MAYVKTFQLETGTITLSDAAHAEQAAKVSIAVSLKRIADALEVSNKKQHKSVFEEVFGSKL